MKRQKEPPRCVYSGHNLSTASAYYRLGEGRYCCEVHIVPYVISLEVKLTVKDASIDGLQAELRREREL